MKLTKIQRRKRYEQALFCVGYWYKGEKHSTCQLLKWLGNKPAKNSLFLHLGEHYPEFFLIKNEMLKDKHPYAGWPDTKNGDEQRRIALEKAIALTYKQSL